MALRAVPEHPKFARLKRTLGIPKFQALGILEALWHFTGKFAPRGNVGKFTNAEIADWIEWSGDADQLIAELVSIGWLDESKAFRLVVHDWHVHADQTTKKQIGRTREGFVSDMSGQHPDMSITNGNRSGPPEPEPEPVPEPVPVPEPAPGKVHGLRADEAEVSLIYQAYPRKVKPIAAAAAIRKAVEHLCSGADRPAMTAPEARQFLHAKVRQFARSPAGNQGEFTPHPASWFNAGRYLEDESEWQHTRTEVNLGAFAGKTNASINAAQQALDIINARPSDPDHTDPYPARYPPAGEAGPGGLLGDGRGPVAVPTLRH